CYCFAARGRGEVRWAYTDGRTCKTPLNARVAPRELSITHPRATCSDGSHIVPENITCRPDTDGTATCDSESLGRMKTRVTGEKSTRVDEAYCGQPARR